MAGMRKASNAAALVALLIVAVAAAAGAMRLCGVERSAVDACRPYCKVKSAQPSPSPACCDKVKAAQWDCLCQFKGSLPDDINATRIMDLQYKCKCDNPPATCSDD